MSCNSLLSSTNADLVGYYSFNETSGTSVADNSGAGNDATASADMSTLTGTGEFGNCITLAGTNYAAATKSGGFASYPFSMGCRFKHEGTAIARTILAISDADVSNIHWWLYLNPSHVLTFARSNTTFISASTGETIDTNWHTAVIVFPDATSAIVYLDGSEVFNSSALTSVAATSAADGMLTGDFRTTDATLQWIGDLDESAFWTDEVSSTEAAEFGAGPEPIWLGTGTHHFNVARGVAYWNCPSTAWGLPTYLNAASTDNGALTAEVRIVRDRGKATEAVVATTTGFSGSVACAGSTDNLTLELRVSNDGGYDDSLGDDADGWVSVAWYGLEARLVGQWNLDEQSGDVARNQVSEELSTNAEFNGGASGADSAGDIPSGWTGYVSVGSGASASREVGADSITLTATGSSSPAATAGVGVRHGDLTDGKTCTFVVRYRWLRHDGACNLNIYTGANNVFASESDPLDTWLTKTITANCTASGGYLRLFVAAIDVTAIAEIDSFYVYEEAAGTYDRDASNTYLSIADLGTIDGGQDFNGSSDEVSLGSHQTSSTVTYTWWEKTSTFGTGQRTWGYGNALVQRTSSTQINYWTQPAGSVALTHPADDGEWHHWSIRANGTAVTLFMDGVQVDAETAAAVPGGFNAASYLGSYTGSQFKESALAAFYVFDRSLTGPEIAQLYAQGPTALVDVGRVAHYKLEETSGTTVADSSASGNDGTSTSNMSTLTTAGMVGRGANLDGTDYISAPWSGGFTYPTSVACVFKLDTLTDASNRTLVSLADASVFDVQWAFGAASTGTNMYVMRRNPGASNQTPVAPLTTNWHTAVIVFHDETSYSIYLDGTLVVAQTGLTSIPASANVDTLLIGLQRLTSPAGYADGITFDEVSAWTRELSASDAAEWHQFTIFPLAARHSAEPLGLETSLSL